MGGNNGKSLAKVHGSYFKTEQLYIETAMESLHIFPAKGFWTERFSEEELLDTIKLFLD